MRGHLPARDHGVMDPAPARYIIRINGHPGAEKWRPYRSLATSYLFSAAFEPAGAPPVARHGNG